LDNEPPRTFPVFLKADPPADARNEGTFFERIEDRTGADLVDSSLDCVPKEDPPNELPIVGLLVEPLNERVLPDGLVVETPNERTGDPRTIGLVVDRPLDEEAEDPPITLVCLLVESLNERTEEPPLVGFVGLVEDAPLDEDPPIVGFVVDERTEEPPLAGFGLLDERTDVLDERAEEDPIDDEEKLDGAL